jgi:hypothetical protein
MAEPTYKGEVVYIYAYDVAYDMKAVPTGKLLGRDVEQFAVETRKHMPRRHPFYRPPMVRLPALTVQSSHGPIFVERTVKVFPVGALSISIRVPFEVATLEELVPYHDLMLGDGTVNDEARLLAHKVLEELRPSLVRPLEHLADEEAYTVFCISSDSIQAASLEDWLVEQCRSVAALLTQETQSSLLSDQEAMETTQRSLSYYEHDLTVIDWDAALVIDDKGNYDNIVHIMELANVQLSELESYDDILDNALERAYRGMRKSRGNAITLEELREIRLDMARLSDELSNSTKFFGDWHLARVYQYVSERFHLADWHRIIDEKLRALDSLYSILKQDQMNKWMMILEVTIVLLFIIDLVILAVPLLK